MTLFFTPDQNPAITLYNHWHQMLTWHGSLEPDPRDRLRGWWNETPSHPRVRYGDYHCGVGVWGFDAQQRPLLTYGGWYRPNGSIYSYLVLDADGRFRLQHPHGDNHQRLEQHTFLGYGHYGGQYIWYVSPMLGPGQSINPRDWRIAQPYLRERVIRTWGGALGTPHNAFEGNWLALDRAPNGLWEIIPVPGQPRFEAAVNADRARTLRAYRRHKRAEVGERPNTVRDGKTTLDHDAAVLRIAALLDVSQPAKAVPMSKTPREVLV